MSDSDDDLILLKNLEDKIIDELSFINNHKDLDRWGDMIDCAHLEHKDEYPVEFCKATFILCSRCVRNLYIFLSVMFHHGK